MPVPQRDSRQLSRACSWPIEDFRHEESGRTFKVNVSRPYTKAARSCVNDRLEWQLRRHGPQSLRHKNFAGEDTRPSIHRPSTWRHERKFPVRVFSGSTARRWMLSFRKRAPMRLRPQCNAVHREYCGSQQQPGDGRFHMRNDTLGRVPRSRLSTNRPANRQLRTRGHCNDRRAWIICGNSFYRPCQTQNNDAVKRANQSTIKFDDRPLCPGNDGQFGVMLKTIEIAVAPLWIVGMSAGTSTCGIAHSSCAFPPALPQ